MRTIVGLILEPTMYAEVGMPGCKIGGPPIVFLSCGHWQRFTETRFPVFGRLTKCDQCAGLPLPSLDEEITEKEPPLAPLHVRAVARPELRSDPEDPTTLPTDRLELHFIMKAEFKHLLLMFHEVHMSSRGARDAARILEQAAFRFARTCKAFADADPKEPE